jgi:hypothetical protein
VFCGDCQEVCAERAIVFTAEHRLAAFRLEDLLVNSAPATTADAETAAAPVRREIRRLFGRSLKLRQVSAGGCNGCEMELNACGNVNFDMGRFGIEFVASPRHADGVVVTGPVSGNMASLTQVTIRATFMGSLCHSPHAHLLLRSRRSSIWELAGVGCITFTLPGARLMLPHEAGMMDAVFTGSTAPNLPPEQRPWTIAADAATRPPEPDPAEGLDFTVDVRIAVAAQLAAVRRPDAGPRLLGPRRGGRVRRPEPAGL